MPKSMLDLRFRSGMSSKSDLRGAMDAMAPVGVVADKLALASKLLSLPRYLNQGGAVFIDSGAFSELNSGLEPDWNSILETYEMVAGASVEFTRLYVVAPDKVGDQQATLSRLVRYKDRVVALIKMGCRVIVPLQRGVLSGMEMLAAAAEILETRNFVAGIPSNKEALPFAECEALRHHSFHILGRVQMDGDQVERIAALLTGCQDASITADANWLRSRLALVQTETERERGRMRVERSNVRRFDHPRAAAISRAILSDCW